MALMEGGDLTLPRLCPHPGWRCRCTALAGPWRVLGELGIRGSRTSSSQAQEDPGLAGASISTPSGRGSLAAQNLKKKKNLIKKLYD